MKTFVNQSCVAAVVLFGLAGPARSQTIYPTQDRIKQIVAEPYITYLRNLGSSWQVQQADSQPYPQLSTATTWSPNAWWGYAQKHTAFDENDATSPEQWFYTKWGVPGANSPYTHIRFRAQTQIDPNVRFSRALCGHVHTFMAVFGAELGGTYKFVGGIGMSGKWNGTECIGTTYDADPFNKMVGLSFGGDYVDIKNASYERYVIATNGPTHFRAGCTLDNGRSSFGCLNRVGVTAELPEGSTLSPYHVCYQAYGNSAWTANACDGNLAITNWSNPWYMTAVKMTVSGNVPGGICYRVHQHGGGWTGWGCDGAQVGTTSSGPHIDGIDIKPRDYGLSKGYGYAQVGFGWRQRGKNSSTGALATSYTGWQYDGLGGQQLSSGWDTAMFLAWLEPSGNPPEGQALRIGGACDPKPDWRGRYLNCVNDSKRIPYCFQYIHDNVDPWCLDMGWDNQCEDEMYNYCGVTNLNR